MENFSDEEIKNEFFKRFPYFQEDLNEQAEESFVVKQSERKHYPFYDEEKPENSINLLENNSFFRT